MQITIYGKEYSIPVPKPKVKETPKIFILKVGDVYTHIENKSLRLKLGKNIDGSWSCFGLHGDMSLKWYLAHEGFASYNLTEEQMIIYLNKKVWILC
jgi:hypothetical protein